jgi:transposase
MNNGCERAFWQRDVNAAINLAKFFLWELNGEEKPTVFQRPRTRAEEDIPDV